MNSFEGLVSRDCVLHGLVCSEEDVIICEEVANELCFVLVLFCSEMNCCLDGADLVTKISFFSRSKIDLVLISAQAFASTTQDLPVQQPKKAMESGIFLLIYLKC